MKQTKSSTRVEPSVGVVDVRERFVQFALIAEVLRVLEIGPGHGHEILGDLTEVRAFRRRDDHLPEGSFRECDIPLHEDLEFHCGDIEAGPKTLSPLHRPECVLHLPRPSRSPPPVTAPRAAPPPSTAPATPPPPSRPHP